METDPLLLEESSQIREKIIAENVNKKLTKEITVSTYRSLFEKLNENLLDRKVSFFSHYVAENLYQNVVFKDSKLLETIFTEISYSSINFSQNQNKFFEIIKFFWNHIDVLASSIFIIKKIQQKGVDFIQNLVFSTIPSIFNFFITFDYCDLFLTFLNKLHETDTELFYKFGQLAFLTPEFMNFVDSVLKYCSIDCSCIADDENAKQFYQEFIKFADDEKDKIGYLVEKLLQIHGAEDILLNSFLKPAAHSPALFGLCSPEGTIQPYTETRLLSAIKTEDVVKRLFHILTSYSLYSTRSSLNSQVSQVSQFSIENQQEIEEDTDMDIFSIIMKIPSFSPTMIFSKNDLILIDFLWTLSDKNQKAESIPTLNEEFELLKVRTEIDLLNSNQIKKSNNILNVQKSILKLPPPIQIDYSACNNIYDVYKSESLPFSFSFERFKSKLALDYLDNNSSDMDDFIKQSRKQHLLFLPPSLAKEGNELIHEREEKEKLASENEKPKENEDNQSDQKDPEENPKEEEDKHGEKDPEEKSKEEEEKSDEKDSEENLKEKEEQKAKEKQKEILEYHKNLMFKSLLLSISTQKQNKDESPDDKSIFDLHSQILKINKKESFYLKQNQNVINFMISNLFFTFEESRTSLNDISNDVYLSGARFISYFEFIRGEATKWTNEKKLQIPITDSAIFWSILSKLDLNKIGELIPIVSQADKDFADPNDPKGVQKELQTINGKESVVQKIRQFSVEFSPIVKMIRDSFQMSTIKGMIKMLNKAFNLFQETISDKLHIKTFGGDEFMPALTEIFLMAKPQSFFSRTILITHTITSFYNYGKINDPSLQFVSLNLTSVSFNIITYFPESKELEQCYQAYSTRR